MRDPNTGERRYGSVPHLRRFVKTGDLPADVGEHRAYLVSIDDLELMRVRAWARRMAETCSVPIDDRVADELVHILRSGTSAAAVETMLAQAA